MQNEAYHMRKDALLRKYPAIGEYAAVFGPLNNIVDEYAEGRADEMAAVNSALQYLGQAAAVGKDALVLEALRRGTGRFYDLQGNELPHLAPIVTTLTND